MTYQRLSKTSKNGRPKNSTKAINNIDTTYMDNVQMKKDRVWETILRALAELLLKDL